MTGGNYHEKLSAECQRIYDYAVEKYEERRLEVQQMKDCINGAIFDSRENGTAPINKSIAYKTEVKFSAIAVTTYYIKLIAFLHYT